VQSNGDFGSGFVATNPGQSNTGSNTATVEAAPAPAPRIIFNGHDITGTAQNVVVGQQIGLSVSGLPTGVSVTSQTWAPAAIGTGQVTLGSIVGGYNASAASGQIVNSPPLSSNTPTSTGTSYNITFYWTQTGSGQYKITYSYCLSSGNCSDPQQATATFNVGGPTGNLLLQANMLTDGSGVQVLPNGGAPILSTTGIPLGAGSVGITFSTNATAPTGYNQSFTWVQLLTSLQYQFVNSAGPFSQYPAPVSGLDNSFPYTSASSTTTNDTPHTNLPSIYGEGWEAFSATMYLMWDPGLPAGCVPAKTVQNPDKSFTSTPSTCASIPVPLSSVTWHWSGCAINTLVNQPSTSTPWLRSSMNGCPVQTLGGPQTADFPQWTTTITN
jgi:hypothetical protein